MAQAIVLEPWTKVHFHVCGSGEWFYFYEYHQTISVINFILFFHVVQSHGVILGRVRTLRRQQTGLKKATFWTLQKHPIFDPILESASYHTHTYGARKNNYDEHVMRS